MPFKFEHDAWVSVKDTPGKGQVKSRADHAPGEPNAENTYMVIYFAADGAGGFLGQNRNWWPESQLEPYSEPAAA